MITLGYVRQAVKNAIKRYRENVATADQQINLAEAALEEAVATARARIVQINLDRVRQAIGPASLEIDIKSYRKAVAEVGQEVDEGVLAEAVATAKNRIG
jgi:hypothetical protein